MSNAANDLTNIKSLVLSFFTGTIDREKINSFEYALFRATLEICIVRLEEVKEPSVDFVSPKSTHKSVFMLFISGTAIWEGSKDL